MITHENDSRRPGAKRLMSAEEMGEYLSLSKHTLYTWVSLRRIPADCIKRVGRSLRFEVAAMDRWINEQNARQPTGSGPK